MKLSKTEQILILQKAKASLIREFYRLNSEPRTVNGIMMGLYKGRINGLCHHISQFLPPEAAGSDITLFTRENAIKYGHAPKPPYYDDSPFTNYWWERNPERREVGFYLRIGFLDWMLCKLIKPSLKDKIINFFKPE